MLRKLSMTQFEQVQGGLATRHDVAGLENTLPIEAA
jgi:hypothetical protein